MHFTKRDDTFLRVEKDAYADEKNWIPSRNPIFFLFLGTKAWAQSPYPDVAATFDIEHSGQGDVAVVIALEDYLLLPSIDGAQHTGRDWITYFRDGLGIGQVYELRDQEATR